MNKYLFIYSSIEKNNSVIFEICYEDKIIYVCKLSDTQKHEKLSEIIWWSILTNFFFFQY